jgi:predicted metal-dependent peptidase
MTHSARGSAALQALTEADPALAALSLWCRHRDIETGLAETDGIEIGYGPGFAALPRHEQMGLAGHHILHVALQHPARLADMAARLGATFDAELWQIAADAIVNEAILAAGHALPRPALVLSDLLKAAPGKAAGGVAALAEWDVDALYHHLAADAEGRARQARKAARAKGFAPDLRPGGAGQKPRPSQSGTPGAKADSQGLAEGQQREASTDPAEWRAHLARAMAAGRAAGFGLGLIGHRLADLPTPSVPWEMILRRLLLAATLPLPRPSPHRPSRSWLARAGQAVAAGAELPPWQARLAPTSPRARIVVGLDCSTSVGPDPLRLMMAEVSGIARRMGGEVILLAFDTDVQIELRLELTGWARQLAGLTLPQGGGTDFAPVIARANALSASALVMLTDLDGPVGPKPRFPVVWAVPGRTLPPAAFGRVISMAR